MTQKVKKLDKAAQTPSGRAPYRDLRGRVSDEFLKSLSTQVIVKTKNINENTGKLGKYKKVIHTKKMDLSERIRQFILNDPDIPSEKANVLAQEWAKSAQAISGDAERPAPSLVLALPEKPMREIRNRENIVEYLRSPEGFGPWIEAGALTRPLLRSISPKAYQSLVNWLRNNELPDDIEIPTKAQIMDRRIDAAGGPDLQEMGRVAAAVRMRAIRRA